MKRLSPFPMTRWLFPIIAGFLVIGAAYGVWWAYSLPTEKQEQTTTVSYQHEGEFEFNVYVTPNSLLGDTIPTPTPTKKPQPKAFTKLIDSVDMTYHFAMVPGKPAIDVAETVRISAVLEESELWSKELVLVPDTAYSGNFTVSFPLPIVELSQLAEDIRSELKISSRSEASLTLRSDIEIQGRLDSRTFTDTFSHMINVKPFGGVLEWDENLTKSQRGSYEALSYVKHGAFEYAVKLIPNSLYGPITITPEVVQLPPDPVLAQGPTYFAKTIQHIEPMYSYRFTADNPLNKVSSEIEIVADLESGKDWSKTVLLASERAESAHATIPFSLDLDRFKQLGETIQAETGAGSPPGVLSLRANVRITAETEGHGTVDETFVQTVTVPLKGAVLEFQGDLSANKSGAIKEDLSVPDAFSRTVRTWMPVALGVSVLLFSTLVWLSTRRKRLVISSVATEASRAKKRHKDVIADVVDVPAPADGEAVVRMASLGDLVKVADALLKPVFHRAADDEHMYCVLSDSVRYEYLSRSEEHTFSVSQQQEHMDNESHS